MFSRKLAGKLAFWGPKWASTHHANQWCHAPQARWPNAVDASAIHFTKGYLQTFEKNLAANTTSAGLIGAMQQAYPS